MQRGENLQSDSDYSNEEESPSSDDLEDYSELESLQLHWQRRSCTRTNNIGEGGSSKRTPAKKSIAQVIDNHSQFLIVHF